MELPTRWAKGRDLSEAVGTPPTTRPLKIGVTTYKQFIDTAGKPVLVSTDHRYLIYEWNTMGWSGFWMLLGVIPLPGLNDWDGSRGGTDLVRFEQDRLAGWEPIGWRPIAGYVKLTPWGMIPVDAYAALAPAAVAQAARK